MRTDKLIKEMARELNLKNHYIQLVINNVLIMKFKYINSLVISFILLVIGSCKNEKTTQVDENSDQPSNVIDIVTRSMEFQSVDTISSGWNTFRYRNLSNETHFLVFEKYPEGINIDSTRAKVFPVFDEGMTLINKGDSENGFKAFEKLPAWFFQIVFTGGVGLVSPNEVGETTLNLQPGNYLMECYVKMKNGKFHSVMGMCKEIVVIDTQSETKEPESTVTIDISTENGIVFNPNIKSGIHTIKVNFIDQKLHEHFLGHDVNLVKLGENANLEELEAWMNWANPKGLIDPAPNHMTFLGGVQEMPTGYTGYFSLNLSKGKYAFIAEVPKSMDKNMLKVFEVSD